MIELAPMDELIRRENLAGFVRGSLAAAGLAVVAPDMVPQVGCTGAEVKVDRLTDCHAPVRIDWIPDRALTDAFGRAMSSGGDDQPAARHYLLVVETMLRAISEILTSDGFTVRDSTNDFAPLSLEVLATPRQGPGWYDDQRP
ncbi:hypothetical protein [Paractinoplanes bogorensis]|uniref:hypothetical protein n=1 Tax=Paractinoplanes bogorensis TaxID=1610840 RepID=UPI001FE75B70|nr:hypothetical protein [Actinoplanes bogorensis]